MNYIMTGTFTGRVLILLCCSPVPSKCSSFKDELYHDWLPIKMTIILGAISIKWIISILILICAVAPLFKNQLRILWLIVRLPGPFAYPIIGNAHWLVDHKRLVRNAYIATKEFGTIIRAWITVFPMVLIFEPDDIQKVLASSKHVEKVYFYKLLHTFLGEGLVTSKGFKWRSHRKLIQPSFHISNLENYVQIFDKGSQILINAIEDQILRCSMHVNVTPIINKCVVNILNEAILGIPTDTKSAFKEIESSPFRQGSMKLQYRMLRPWLLLNSVYKLTELAKREINHKNSIIDFTRKIIKKRREMLENGTVENKCFLDYLIKISENTDNFSEEDCINEACTFMLAGQDTVGACVAFCLHEIAQNPDVQEKIMEELEFIFGTSQRPVTPLDLREMKYLDQCVKETMRLYPSVPVFARTLGEDVKLKTHTLPKGCDVVIIPFATHRLSEIFPNPEVFNPDRFDPDEVEQRHPYAYIPFSAGPRNCIGNKFAILEIKTIVSNILRKFSLAPVRGKEVLNLKYRVTLRVSGGIWIAFSPRMKETQKLDSVRDL